MDNVITIVGNLSRDPELRYTSSGTAVANFSIALNERRRNPQTNEWEDGDTTFVNVVAWRDLGEHIAQSLQKGMRAFVVGKIKQRSWDDQETGKKRSVLELVASEAGPSLRWATCSVDKATRHATSSAPPVDNVAPSDPVYGDEEPF